MCGGVACHKCWQQFLKFHSWNYYANAAAAHMYLKKSLEPQLFQGLFFKSEVYLSSTTHFHFLHIYIYTKARWMSSMCLDVFYSQATWLSNSHFKSWLLVIANSIFFFTNYISDGSLKSRGLDQQAGLESFHEYWAPSFDGPLKSKRSDFQALFP